MKIVRHGARTRVAAVGVVATGALFLAGCGASNEGGASSGSAPTSEGAAVSGQIAGAGATSQQAAMEAWIAGFSGDNPDATVSYDPTGSGAGRTQFLAGAVQFAGSDSAMKDDELATAATVCTGADNVIQVPLYISPIAVVYNLEGVDKLQLSAPTIAKIFDKKITTWNDPAIAAENPGVTLPATNITPVNRSDKSGTTENFTQYLKAAAPSDWTYDTSDSWPVQGGEAAQGTSGVIGAVKGGQGTIGYADESQAKDLGIVSVKVGESYVAPSAEAAAKVVEASPRVEGKGKYNFAVSLARDTTEAGAYPVVLVSYSIACTKYSDAAKAGVVKAFLQYTSSEAGQAAAAKNAGNAPISAAQRTQFTPAIDAIGAS